MALRIILMDCELDLSENHQGVKQSSQQSLSSRWLYYFLLHIAFYIYFYLLHSLFSQVSPFEQLPHAFPSIYGLLGKLPLQRKKKSFIHNFKWFVKYLQSFFWSKCTENTINCWLCLKNIRIIFLLFIFIVPFLWKKRIFKSYYFSYGKRLGLLIRIYIGVWPI